MNILKIFATFFYIGKSPFSPGTLGSLCGLLVWMFIPLNFIIQSVMIILFFIIGIISSKKISVELNESDPSEIVIDEVVGIWVSLFMIPHNLVLYLLAFLLFRVFDIFKPSFIYSIQKLPNGWGIMLDDLFAGFFSLLIVLGFLSTL